MELYYYENVIISMNLNATAHLSLALIEKQILHFLLSLVYREIGQNFASPFLAGVTCLRLTNHHAVLLYI